MKKILSLTIIIVLALSIIPNYSYAAESRLIQNTQLSLKTTETPQRLEVSFALTEPLDLSKGNSNIIYEYFTEDNNGNLETLNYKKDKLWSGYINSYDNYPSGEHKYSSGAEKAAYSDNVPATTIYTSTKTNANIDVSTVAAVKVTVLRAEGSGEKVTIYSNGAEPTIEKIEIPVVDIEQHTGIRLSSTTANIPEDTILIATKLTSGSMFETASAVLSNVRNFLVYDIKLGLDGEEIQPDGTVKISIPIPKGFDTSRLAVYRIENDETKTAYPVAITTVEGENFATFETEHFSTYALAELTESEAEAIKDETPKTGPPQTIHYVTAIAILSAIGILVSHKKRKVNVR